MCQLVPCLMKKERSQIQVHGHSHHMHAQTRAHAKTRTQNAHTRAHPHALVLGPRFTVPRCVVVTRKTSSSFITEFNSEASGSARRSHPITSSICLRCRSIVLNKNTFVDECRQTRPQIPLRRCSVPQRRDERHSDSRVAKHSMQRLRVGKCLR